MTDWNETNLETLRLGVEAGDSFSQIAKRIPFCTRNGAIGKALRAGFRQHAKPSAPRAVRAPAVKRAPYQNAGLAFATRTFCIAGRAVPFRDEPSGSATVLTIGRNQCRWPIGDPQDDAFTFCGAHADGTYCAEHHPRAHQAIPANRPQTGNELQRSLRRYL